MRLNNLNIIHTMFIFSFGFQHNVIIRALKTHRLHVHTQRQKGSVQLMPKK